MFIEHPDFEQPKDTSTKLWRYMDLPKFLSILDTSSLYFTRSDKFIDPFEGTIPKINYETILKYFSEHDNADKIKEELLNLFDVNRKLTLINCWYQSEYESDAMWQLYSNNGVAIQTRFEKLKESISVSDDKILIGQVKYIDYDKEGMLFLNAMTPFLFKRISFEHEKELRAVIWNIQTDREPEGEDDKIPIKIVDHGKHSKIDVSMLIENVYVSPTAPSWFHKLITSILRKYNIDKPVIHSRLYTVDNLSNQDTIKAKNEIIFSKDILEHFYKKDSFRINIETLKEEREKFREYENYINEIKSLEADIEKCSFTSKQKYIGKDALFQFCSKPFTKKETETLSNKALFKLIYFTNGKVHTLMNDINKSKLSDKEKEILLRKVIYFYSENISQPALFLVQTIEKHNLTDAPLQMFTGFTKYMTQLTLEMQV